jgi:hypothetical protein
VEGGDGEGHVSQARGERWMNLQISLLDIVTEASDLASGAHLHSESRVSATQSSEREHRHLHSDIVIV